MSFFPLRAAQLPSKIPLFPPLVLVLPSDCHLYFYDSSEPLKKTYCGLLQTSTRLLRLPTDETRAMLSSWGQSLSTQRM